MIRLIHRETGAVLANRLEVARTLRERMRGLLGRRGLPPGGGLLIENCASIHTFFMRFPIDVVFADADWRVRKLVRRLRPWRVAGAIGAAHVVELPAGTLEQAGAAPGDMMHIEAGP